jgi:hypothetical protein
LFVARRCRRFAVWLHHGVVVTRTSAVPFALTCYTRVPAPHAASRTIGFVVPGAALPKGGINESHVLIVPIAHHDSFAAAPASVQLEATRFLTALAAMWAPQGRKVVSFERVLHMRGRNDMPVHTHIQAIAVPDDVAARAEQTLITEGAFRQMKFEKLAPDVQLADAVTSAPPAAAPPTAPAPDAPDAAAGAAAPAPSGSAPAAAPSSRTGVCEYLYVEVPAPDGDSTPVRLLHRVPPGTKHPLQFGREVLCRLLNCPDRLQWKACAVSVDQETAQTTALREQFKPFDFTLEL